MVSIMINQSLLRFAYISALFAISGERTRKAAVTKALQEFIARREQKRLAELFGSLEWDTDYDCKAERSRD